MTNESTQIEANAIEAAQARLKDYLRGYGRGQVFRLDQLANLDGWELEAGRVLRARQRSLLTALDDELLRLIERGQVAVPALALAVAQELDGEGGGRCV